MTNKKIRQYIGLIAAVLVAVCVVFIGKYNSCGGKSNGAALESRTPKSTFDFTLEGFMQSFNSEYEKTHESVYFTAGTGNRSVYKEPSPLFGCEAERRIFSADKSVWPKPTYSFYSSADGGVYEIRITFDDHSYKENYYAQFKELCLCTEKLLMPGLSQEELQSLLERLIVQSEVNIFGDHSAFGDPERPALDKVYRVGDIGAYGFYGSGNTEICFVPLGENAVSLLGKEGVPLVDL